MAREYDEKTEADIAKRVEKAVKEKVKEFKGGIADIKEMVKQHADDAGSGNNPDAKKRLKALGGSIVEHVQGLLA